MRLSDFNPHAPEFAAIEARWTELTSELARVEDDLCWFSERTLESIETAIRLAEKDLASAKEMVCKLESARDHCETGVRLYRYQASQARSEQERLRVSHLLAVEEKKTRDVIARLSLEQQAVVQREQWIDEFHGDHRKWANFDAGPMRARASELSQEIQATEQERERIRPSYEQVQELIAPFELELEGLEGRRAKLREKYARAEELKDEVEHSGSYGRAMAHRESEDRFGDPSPSRVLRGVANEMRGVERDLAKLRRRIESVVSRASRHVSRLVIDGNNLCYQDGSFCGLGPLRTIIPVLVQSHPVLVIFDASIRRRLGLSDEAIRRELEGADVHVVATSQKADETLLDLADAADTYVLSNDRFNEFPDKPAVDKGRLIRHEIVAGRILIHDLDVDATFSIAV